MGTQWIDVLRAGGVLLLDGGTGSELRRRGVALDANVWSALASVEHFDTLRAIHADYIAAGADVITTNTFATSRFVLEAAGRGERFSEINDRALAAAFEARDASGRNVAIAGSLSCLPPRFDATAYPSARDESAAYVELAELLAHAGVDVLALEMLEDVEHAARACEAASATGLPLWLGVSCRVRGDGTLAAFDFPETPFATVLDATLRFEPDVVNVMHSPPEAVLPALREVRARFGGTLGAYPELDSPATHAEPLDPAELASLAPKWLRAGARIVGGCCGATPEHVRALRAAIDATVRPAEPNDGKSEKFNR
jgi:S-methylmethionine-dependent homocysteine/selenocysteine methylase